jgi:hypothetical protein
MFHDSIIKSFKSSESGKLSAGLRVGVVYKKGKITKWLFPRVLSLKQQTLVYGYRYNGIPVKEIGLTLISNVFVVPLESYWQIAIILQKSSHFKVFDIFMVVKTHKDALDWESAIKMQIQNMWLWVCTRTLDIQRPMIMPKYINGRKVNQIVPAILHRDNHLGELTPPKKTVTAAEQVTSTEIIPIIIAQEPLPSESQFLELCKSPAPKSSNNLTSSIEHVCPADQSAAPINERLGYQRDSHIDHNLYNQSGSNIINTLANICGKDHDSCELDNGNVAIIINDQYVSTEEENVKQTSYRLLLDRPADIPTFTISEAAVLSTLSRRSSVTKPCLPVNHYLSSRRASYSRQGDNHIPNGDESQIQIHGTHEFATSLEIAAHDLIKKMSNSIYAFSRSFSSSENSENGSRKEVVYSFHDSEGENEQLRAEFKTTNE